MKHSAKGYAVFYPGASASKIKAHKKSLKGAVLGRAPEEALKAAADLLVKEECDAGGLMGYSWRFLPDNTLGLI